MFHTDNGLYLAKVMLLVLASTTTLAHGYSSGVPPVDRRALAGLWKLTPSVLSIKEFTVHPRKPPKKQEELLLMLNEDGSFTRYEESEIGTEEYEEEEENSTPKNDVDQSWKQFVRHNKDSSKETIKAMFKGTWDYRDGELILAADRDEQRAKSDNYDSNNGDAQHKANVKQQNLFWKKGKDTILVGAVVAAQNGGVFGTYQQPQLQQSNAQNATATSSQQSQQPASTSLSNTQQQNKVLTVPMGSVQVGKFFYPKNHPSFFDQPIFRPKRFGTFQLKQVLGSYNAADKKEDELVEKFRNQDFHNKRFFLTSSPIEPRRPKGNVRWSIKYNKYVEDPPSKEAQKAADAEKNRLVSTIRVLKVMIHANNTFSTLAGLGDTTILRGRFNVIGDQRDQVWMQSVRFGFGRSVSGSTYSEGNALGEETKSYWGKISYLDDDDDDDVNDNGSSPKDPLASAEDGGKDHSIEEKPKRLQVKGTVLVGWGLEPQPIARFIMREADDDSEFFDTYDDDDEEDEDDEEEEQGDGEEEEGDIWSSGNTDAFQ